MANDYLQKMRLGVSTIAMAASQRDGDRGFFFAGAF